MLSGPCFRSAEPRLAATAWQAAGGRRKFATTGLWSSQRPGKTPPSSGVETSSADLSGRRSRPGERRDARERSGELDALLAEENKLRGCSTELTDSDRARRALHKALEDDLNETKGSSGLDEEWMERPRVDDLGGPQAPSAAEAFQKSTNALK